MDSASGTFSAENRHTIEAELDSPRSRRAEQTSWAPPRLRRLVWALAHPIVWSGIGLLAALMLLYGRMGAAKPDVLIDFFNADALFPVHVYKDVAIDGFPFAGWKLPMAPWIFPDIPLACLCMMLTGHAAVANFAYGAVQIVLLACGFAACCRSLGLTPLRLYATSMITAATLIVVMTAIQLPENYPPFHQLFTPQSHAGTLASAFWAAACAFSLVQERTAGWRKWSIAVALSGLCCLSTMSDMFFVFYFLLPFTGAGVIAIYSRLIPTHRLVLPIVIGWAASIAGAKLVPVLLNAHSVLTPAHLNRDGLFAASRTWSEEMWARHIQAPEWIHWSGTLWVVFCLMALLAAVRLQITAGNVWIRERRRWSLPVIFLAFLALASVLPWMAVVATGHETLSGSNQYVACTRYAPTFFWTPFFGWAAAIATGLSLAFRSGRALAWLTRIQAAATFGGPLILAACYAPSAGSLREYYPPLVKFLDEHAASHKLTHGVTGFWTARNVTLFSKSGLRAYQFTPDLQPFIWLGNQYWYTQRVYGQSSPPPFNFIVTDGWIQASAAIAKFGRPAETLSFQGHEILVYERPIDLTLRNITSNWTVTGHCEYFPAAILPSQVGLLQDTMRVATEGATPQGFVTFGPYVKLPPGEYGLRLEVDAQAKDERVGIWDAGHFEREPLQTLASGSIQPEMAEIQAFVSVTKERPLEMRVMYLGRGALAVRGLTITRVR